jgi:hypothetical protein
MGKTDPNWEYLAEKFDIRSAAELKKSLLESCEEVDFSLKAEEFGKLIFDRGELKKVRLFRE